MVHEALEADVIVDRYDVPDAPQDVAGRTLVDLSAAGLRVVLSAAVGRRSRAPDAAFAPVRRLRRIRQAGLTDVPNPFGPQSLQRAGVVRQSSGQPAGVSRALHSEIIDRPEWVIDGYGSLASAWERFAVADTRLCRSAASDALLGRDEAPHEGTFQNPSRLAREQSCAAKLFQFLSGRVAMPYRTDAEISEAYCGSLIQTPPPLAILCRDEPLLRGRSERLSRTRPTAGMLSSPRSPSSTTRIFSSARKVPTRRPSDVLDCTFRRFFLRPGFLSHLRSLRLRWSRNPP